MKTVKKFIKTKTDRILNWSQKYFELDTKYILKSGFWIYINYFINVSLSTIAAFFMIRMLTKDEYASYHLALSIVGTLAVFSLTGIKTSAMRASALDYDYSLLKAIKLRAKFSILASIVSVGLSFYFSLIAEKVILSKIFLFGAILLPFYYSFNTCLDFLVGKEKFKLKAQYEITLKFIINTVLIIMLFLFRNIIAIVLWILVAHILIYLITYLKCKELMKNKKEDPHLFKYGIKLSIIKIIPNVATYFDKLIISYFMGLNNLAIYSVALLIPSTIETSLMNSGNLFFSRLTKIKKEDFLKKWGKILPYYFMIIIGLILITVYTIPPILNFINIEYAPSIIYSQLLCVIIILAIPHSIFLAFLKAQKKTKEIFHFNLITGISKIFLLTILTFRFKIYGTIAGVIIFKIISFILLYHLTKKTKDETK